MNNARTNSAVQSSASNPAWGDQSSDRLGYDGAGRMITKRHLDATVSDTGYTATSALVGFTTAYDHASNKRYERHLHAESRSHLYPGLDSLDRLLQYQRGTLQEAGNGDVTVATAIGLSGTDSDRAYDRLGYDGAGRTITKRYLDATARERFDRPKKRLTVRRTASAPALSFVIRVSLSACLDRDGYWSFVDFYISGETLPLPA